MKSILLIFLTLSSLSLYAKTINENNAKFLKAPYVLLISLDGFRHDYIQKHDAKFLKSLLKISATVKGLRPPFPSKTFPSHLSAITGLYPDHHGIVGNRFYDPKRKESYSFHDGKAVGDGSFYSGMPLWSLAVSQGMVAATYFWPGSEAEIGGWRPTYWQKYRHEAPHHERIDQIIQWLKLPEKNRPHFLTLYLHDVDSAGHKFGPDSPMTKSAVKKVDQSLKKLFNELGKLHMPINTIIVADHGMNQLDEKKNVVLRPLLTAKEKKLLKHFHWSGKGPIIQFHLKEMKNKNHVSKMIAAFKRIQKDYQVYTRQTIPKNLNFYRNPRFGEIMLLADPGVSLYVDDPKISKREAFAGNHGYNPYIYEDMNGIFIAHGPQFKNNYVLNQIVDNIHIYPQIADILGLKISQPIDGKYEALKEIRMLPSK